VVAPLRSASHGTHNHATRPEEVKSLFVPWAVLGCRTQFVAGVRDGRKVFMNWGADVLKGGVMILLHRVVFHGDHLQDIRNLGVPMGFKVVEEG
jgi:hypothetical protein